MHEPHPLVSSNQDTVSLPDWVESSRESLSGAAVRSSIRARLFPQISPPTPQRVGRFAILRKLGRGGMGVVYAAYDERLDRKVALKLVRSSFTANGPELLTLEAQGLAKLSHPNVVQVHEVGEHDGELFIAMEFIAGQTLRSWCETPRPCNEILATLVQAGRGLEAAHAAGLVHRDFKPDNVLVGDDGRARVLDFGLARTIDLVDGSEDLPSTLESNESATQTLNPRKLAGTPNYMAPELFTGAPGGAKADQWAFCVVAYEALFKVRPFSGASLWDLATAVIEAQPAAIAGRTDVPARIRAIIMRGLSKSADDRWASMTELLAALESATERRATLRGLSIAALLGGGLALLGAVLGADPSPPLCPLDRTALSGTWDDERRVELEQRYAASELPYADAAASMLVEQLDAWADDYVEARHQACVTTKIEGTQSEALLDARIACFDRQRAEVEGLLALVHERPAATVVAGSPALVDAVPQIAACQGALDPEALPEDPEQRAAIQTASKRLKRANGLLILGDLGEARLEFEALADDPAVHGHAPLELELRLRRAELEFHAGRSRASLDALHSAALDARSLGLRELETEILVRAAMVSAEAGTLELAPWVLREAEQTLVSRNRPSDPRHARMEWARGRLAQRNGELDQARRSFERALAHGREFGEPFASEPVLLDIGNVEALSGDLDQAKQTYERALERERERWGPKSPTVGHIERALGALALERGELEDAEARFDAAAQIFAADGPTAPALALVADGQAKLAFQRGDLGLARRYVERSLKILETNGELETDAACNLTIALGVIRYFKGDFEGSKAAYERALSLIRKVYGDHHSLIGLTRSNIGESLLALGQLDRARAEFVAALAVLEPALEPEDSRLALPLSGLGLCDLEEGDHALAAHRLERALALVDGVAEPQELAKIQFGLARALAGSGGDIERARELASAAAAGYERLELHDQRAAASAWLR